MPVWCLVVACGGASAGDILRGGAVGNTPKRDVASGTAASNKAAAQAASLAKDRLSRTTQSINAVRAMQAKASARSVPNGLQNGGLKVLTGPNARWEGAQMPSQNGNTVTVKQKSSQAMLHWETFNVGRETTLYFDQTEGKADAGKWIAFNKVFDPAQKPSEILGSIKAEGQVYILNQNGVIFGAGSQVNVRTLVASALPINDNLVANGLLNNRDSQFLFSGLTVPGGSDGTPAFIPPTPPTSGRYGDIVVESGAFISSAANTDGNGGRVMLVGANVKNSGVISTPSGQAILAAGLQVGVEAHDGNDPSLRGLDVWVGSVGTYAGSVINSGLIESQTGSIMMVGRNVEQLGALDSSTSVNLNGRIDLLASYGAVGNPNFDNTGGGPPFLSQFTGSVKFGPSSVTRILPDYYSGRKVPGLSLPESSQINVYGQTINVGGGATILATSGDLLFKAGSWVYKDTNGNGIADESAIITAYEGRYLQRFILDSGEVTFEAGALVDVSGSTGAFVPLAQNVVQVQLRGSELADSPVLRNSALRGIPLTVDLRRLGSYLGRQWVGTPLGDLNGLAGIIERDAAQLTARGGTIDVQAGGSIKVNAGATLDVSGGHLVYEGGGVRTSRLLRGNTLIDIDSATPDVLYDGVYEGRGSKISQKWGVVETYANPLAPMGGYSANSYVEGAAGGSMSFTAPTLSLDGELLGRTLTGPQQLEAAAKQGSLQLNFRGQKTIIDAGVPKFVQHSPTPPSIIFVNGTGSPGSVTTFSLGIALLDPEEGGFGNLSIDNRDGDVLVPQGTKVQVPPGGSLVVQAANISLDESISAPGGRLDFTAYNYSPYAYELVMASGGFSGVPAPLPVDGRGRIRLAPGKVLDVSGMTIDERTAAVDSGRRGIFLNGGTIALEGYSVSLGDGSLLNADGGRYADLSGRFAYGDGGDISVLAGKDPVLSTTIGGTLSLGGTMRAYSFATGGSLAIQANLIQIGGVASDPRMLLLQPDFFRKGGFTDYSLIGIGGRDGVGEYIPAIRLTAGTTIEPAAASPVMTKDGIARGLVSMRAVGLRSPTNISLSGIGADDTFVPLGGLPDLVDALGYVLLEQGSRIQVDPEASVSISGDAIGIFGSIIAPGGLIDIAGDNTFRLSTTQRSQATFALPTVHIGSSAVLSTAGTSILVPDPYGRRAGTVYAGGEIRVAGNIVAESGALLDVSGTSEILDFHPTRLGIPAGVPLNAGINSTPWGIRTVPVRVDTDAGRIQLTGGEMLYTDATLLGAAGGPTAFNGTLAVSSGRFYAPLEIITSEDINMIVEQTGSASQFGATAAYGNIADFFTGRTDLAAAFLAGGPNKGMGYFAVDQFVKGRFDSLDLNYYLGTKADVPLGGNVEFRGPVSISARAFLRVAGGGIIKSDSAVALTAPYVAIGREFLDPLNPSDVNALFRTTTASGPIDYFPQPTYGSGTLSVNASLIDVGTLVLGGIGSATLSSTGDIRGNGTLNISGDLTMKASQVYPTTLSEFDIFAYDRGVRIASASASSSIVTLASAILPDGFGVGSPLLGSVVQSISGTQVTLAANANMDVANRVAVYAPGSGSVTILGGGQSAPPLSAGGSLGIYASTITQSGTLQAPMGTITLGWDGLDLDPSDTDIDQPTNLVTNSAAPVTQQVTLSAGSVTSVSGIDPRIGQGVLVPFGISEDGLSWTDPRGVNVSITGLPQRKVSVSGNSLVTEAGSIIDLRGGGDLFAYRWVPGTGGSVDLLGTAVDPWSDTAGTSYEAGDLVTYGGQTWSARVAIDHASFSAPPAPGSNRYWALVPESYAVVPGYDSLFAPFNTFNSAVGADPGYVAAGLAMGDQIYLGASPGLKAGSYTLLPRRYALLPGAFLVTPQTTGTVSGVTTVEGSSYVAGYRFNAFQPTVQLSPLRDTFEVAPPVVLAQRAQYDLYSANQFMAAAALRADILDAQPLPMDAGHLTLSGNTVLNLAGGVLATPALGGRGASADITSAANMYVVGGMGTAPGGAGVVLNDALLSSWGIESLLLGGLRYETADGTAVQARTSDLILDNPGSDFSGPEISLVSRSGLHVTAGSSITSSGGMNSPAETLLLAGDGTALRVSADADAAFSRTAVPTLNTPLMMIGAGATISGQGVILDSTYGTSLDSAAELIADALTLGSGQISIVLANPPGGLIGSQVNPHLVLAGDALLLAERSRVLTLQSYRTIDVYGAGEFGSPTLESLRLLGGGLRGFDQGAGTATILAADVLFSNPTNVAALAAPPGAPSGSLAISSETIRLGSNAFSVLGYQQLNFLAAGGVYAQGTGSFSTSGALTVTAPRVSAAQGINHSITASGGALNLLSAAGPATVEESGLGATLSFTGTSVTASSDIYLPSGSLTLKATNGNLTVGGRLSVEGSAREFYDLMRYADAGQIALEADQGSVTVQSGAKISVAAHADGGDAGTLIVKTPQGSFNSQGTLLGQGGTDGLDGSFVLDSSNLASYSDLSNELNAGGFTESRTVRVRSGDVTITGNTIARHFTLSTDLGSIYVAGTIDASGKTGGSISLMARNDVELQGGSILDVHGQSFSNAGKGGEIHLEAGTVDASGNPNLAASVRVLTGSTIDLGVDGFAAGAYTDPNASAFYGNFTGTLHIRAPRVGTGVNVGALQGTIIDPSAIIVEAYRVYDRTAVGGTVDSTLRNQMHADNTAFMAAGEASIRSALLAGITDPIVLAAIDQALVVAPGVEIINRTGDLLLGTPGNATGTNPAEDWDLSSYRYGSRQAPGILTMRAAGNLVFRNALSDGFAGFTAQQGAPQAGLRLWLANLMAINGNLPINAQSWSYRLTAGADLSSANFRSVLASVPSGSGSLQLGNFYATNLFTNSLTAGQTATTAAAISPAGTTTRFQVIRTGTGDIDISTAADVQLRNQFASIYTAGVRVPNPTQIFAPGDFSLPSVQYSVSAHPDQGALGAVQQNYPAQWALSGGNVSVQAVADIRRITQVTVSGVTSIVTDTSRQIPTNWLYRRGYVDQTGDFGIGGTDAGQQTVNDASASTAWWIDYSNFFQGFGALGGGDVSLVAGRDIINADAFIPTNARMAGLAGGVRIAPNADNLLEYGGGDLTVQAGRNIDGGSYYVERGEGRLVAGGEIKTNGSRSPSLGYIAAAPGSVPDSILTSRNPAVYDPLTWLPTMLYLGRGSFDVTARGNVLLGPVVNPSLMPQGVNNKFWYKTYFQTYGEDSTVTVTSLGGDVTHRLNTAVPGSTSSRNILQAWIEAQNYYSSSAAPTTRASNTQPWIRVVESSIAPFATALSVGAPNLLSTSFSGDINIAGSMNLFPSATGTIELAAADAINGLNAVGRGLTGSPSRPVTIWTTGRINLSDTNPDSIFGITNPLGYQTLVGRLAGNLLATRATLLSTIDLAFNESGSITGTAATVESKRALHDASILHENDPSPAKLYAAGGNISGLTFYSAKFASIVADNDITDVAFYIQNVGSEDISIVSAGRDIVPYNENSTIRSIASDLSLGNLIVDPAKTTVLGTSSRVLAGDIQVSGPGFLEVLAGRNIDLGTGPNYLDGTGTGITSIGNARNPFLQFEGASLIVLSGVGGIDGGAALGLGDSTLDIEGFIAEFLSASNLSGVPVEFDTFTGERRNIAALDLFFAVLRQSGDEAALTGDYELGYGAIAALFGETAQEGEIFTRARDIRTASGGSITLAAPAGGLTLASDIFGNPLTPPGIVTAYGGAVSVFTQGDVDIGQARIFTLRGGDITMWSSTGDIAAGSAPKTVVTAPPTRVLIDATSADIQTDLGGLATGGGIGTLKIREDAEPSNVYLIAPEGTVDAGDAGIRATGNVTIAAVQVLNADNIAAGGSAVGVPTTTVAAAPNIGSLTSASSATGATSSAATQVADQSRPKEEEDSSASIFSVEVLGYGGGEDVGSAEIEQNEERVQEASSPSDPRIVQR